jgi:hypothetical protein
MVDTSGLSLDTRQLDTVLSESAVTDALHIWSRNDPTG